MHVIRVEIPAVLRTRDPGLSLASDEIRGALFSQLAAVEYELSEGIRHRAAGYFPASFSIFVRLGMLPEKIQLTSEFWVVDPSSRWPQALLIRRAWRLFVPILAHIARETIEQRVPEITVDINEKAAKVGAFASARAWRDPVILAAGVGALTTALWLWAVPAIWPAQPRASISRLEDVQRAPPPAPLTAVSPLGAASPAAVAAPDETRGNGLGPASASNSTGAPAAGKLGVPQPIEVPRRPDDRKLR